MFRVATHRPSGVLKTVTAASGIGHNTGTATSLQCGLIRPRWREVAGVVSGLQPGHYSSLTSSNLQPTSNQERNDQCGNQHYSRELLMMGMVVPETC